MKKILLFLALVCWSASRAQQREIGNLVFENIPEIPSSLPDQMNRYQNTRPATSLGWSPKGYLLISTRFGESSQLHILEQPLGARKQVTFFKEPITWGRFCPDPAYNGFLFLKDVGGNEFAQLYWYDLNTGNYQLLTDGKRSQNGAALWSNKGDHFIYNSTSRNGKDYDIYLAPISTPTASKLILEVSGSWHPVDWSPDDKKVLLKQYISANSSKLFILDLSNGNKEEINPSAAPISYGDAQFSDDGKGLFLVSDEGGEFHTLKYLDLTTKKQTTLSGQIPWDAAELVLNPKRTRGLVKFNVNGIDELYELDCRNHKYYAITGIQKGLIGGLYYQKDGSAFSFHLSTAKIPGDVFDYRFFDRKVNRWTEGELGGLKEEQLSGAQLFHYPTFDKEGDKQRELPAFIYRPNQTDKDKRSPVLIIIHGGPEGQSRPGFSSFVSYLNNELGIVVIQPNVRGSTGYGKTYLQMDNGYNREQSVQDIGALLDWINDQPDLDPQRIGVMGGSYGGYMSLATMTHYNDKLRCGVDVVGISNFVTFLKNTEEYRRDLRRVEYGDERDPKMAEFLEKISPLTNCEKITKPMLVVQGANDPRVPLSEAEQMKNKLLEKKVPTWYLMAKDEGHGFRKKSNVDYYQWTVALFLKKHLLE